MENKGLNIFNSAYVLADPSSATDTDYENILGVIGHEYFHNWTGNRVTVRDWFQLTLKEGLTVFRDQVCNFIGIYLYNILFLFILLFYHNLCIYIYIIIYYSGFHQIWDQYIFKFIYIKVYVYIYLY